MKKMRTNILNISFVIITLLFVACGKDDVNNQVFAANEAPVTQATPGQTTTTQTEEPQTNTNTETATNTEQAAITPSDGSTVTTDTSLYGSFNEITSYKVKGETIEKIKDYPIASTELSYQQDVKTHLSIWNLVKQVVPATHLSKIVEFVIFNGEKSEVSGYVTPEGSLSEWKFAISIDIAKDPQDLLYTIIHEYGHILTLNNTQVDENVLTPDCSNYHTGEGCANTNSYINNVVKNHWLDIIAEHNNISENPDLLDGFYTKYGDRFVTDYAATNPGEDLAELFAKFVIANDAPTGTSVVTKKIQILYSYPELTQIRNSIRSNLKLKSKSGAGVSLGDLANKTNVLGKRRGAHKGCIHSRR